ncbi:MAG TPA: AMP-binding protein, partial [Candidatus Saccharimonadia bacterium]|nr:AMP-binding protein [Candidatus Saccharimonadia bacterium]
WAKPFTKVKNVSWDPDDLHIKWFEDGALNVAANCIDRHLEKRGNQTAIIWEGDDPKDSKHITYRQLHGAVCRFANVLKARGVKKGDRVTIYLPMIPETAAAMLACSRIGAVHSVVFGGFSPDSLAGRITDCDSKVVITADEGLRAGKPVRLKINTDAALKKAKGVTDVLVVRRTGGKVPMQDGRDRWYHEEAAKVPADCPAEAMSAEDPLFILYTSGSTGKPKGVLHTSGGYLLYASATHHYVFDYHDGDVYWCTADVGWVTGHSYILYGPLANGATTLMFEGVPNYPSTSRFWDVIVVQRTGGKIAMKEGRDVWYHEAASKVSTDCPAEAMNAEDPLFILYTSGSTGKPKGVLHTSGGYLLYASATHHYVFDYHDGDIYWCTADVGWVTGHSYILYGPLANGATTLMFEGVPNYPSSSRSWDVIDKHKVNIFYTAPTAIRALMREGDGPVKKTSRASLRLLGSVGEPINPEAWLWYHRVVGDGRCPIVDTWWQTETGGILISPLPGATDLKPGSATKPLFGIVPQIVDADGEVLEGAVTGNLCIAQSWPGQMRTVYGDHQRFIDTYFKAYPGKYFTGDGCRRDADGYYWITGRVDDVINVSGHRLGTAELESALVGNAKVAEAAVVGYP